MPKERRVMSVDVNVFGEISKKPTNEKKLNHMEYRSLIQLVKRRPCLWNNYNHDFRNSELTRKLWDEVGAPLDLSGIEAKKKWKNIKDKYRKLMHQQKRCSGDVPKPKWSFYEEMEFCKDIILPDRSSRNYQTNNHDEDEGDFNEDEFPSSLFTSSLEEEETDKLQPTQITEIESSEFLPSASEQSNEDCRFTRVQANSAMIVKQETCPLVEEEKSSSIFSLPMKQEGDDYYFLMSLLPYIEALNPIEKLELRSKLLASVIEAFKNHEYQKV